MLNEDLPVPFLGYHFYLKLDDTVQASDSAQALDDKDAVELVYKSLFDVILPWHESHPKLSAQPKVVKRSEDIKSEPIVRVVMRKSSSGRHFPFIEIEVETNGETPVGNWYLQVSCKGQRTPATKMKTKPS